MHARVCVCARMCHCMHLHNIEVNIKNIIEKGNKLLGKEMAVAGMYGNE